MNSVDDAVGNSPVNATLPDGARSNSQVIARWWATSVQPSLAPTKPTELRTKGRVAPRATATPSFSAARTERPSTWYTVAVFPHPPTLRCGAAST